MARANPILANFNGGVLSPLLSSRPDLEKYQAGLLLSENAVPRVQGALERRGGSRYVAAIKSSAHRCWLMPFIYAQLDAFVLEWGDQYLRFYRNRGVHESSPGVAYEIATPYSIGDLTEDDGSFALRFQQSGDVIYVTHASKLYAPRKLTRVSSLNWTLAVLTPTGGPFKDINTDETISAKASAATGSGITLTASASIFEAGHVGALFYLEVEDYSSAKPWAQRMKFVVGDLCRSDGKFYECTDDDAGTGVTGDVKPVHTRGEVWDGDGQDITGDNYGPIGLKWKYKSAGYGWARITSLVSGTVANADVVEDFPAGVVGTWTYRWAHAAWSDREGWPDTVTFYRDRLAFFRERRGWCSVSGDYENFAGKLFGLTDASSALSFQIQSGRGESVKWLAPGGQLLAGTGGSEIVISEQVQTQAFGPGNVKQDEQEGWGSSGVQPVKVGGCVLFVEKSGRAVRELVYSQEVDTYTSADLTEFSEHLFTSPLTQLAYERKPRAVLWASRSDGLLLACTYLKQQNVAGWHTHPIGGSGIVESVVVIPSPDGSVDDVWMIVRRTIDGATARYVEYLTQSYRTGDDAHLAAYSDSHLTYDGAAATTISGLSHLEGETVQVMADGASHADCTVSGGAITLDLAAEKVVVGLSAPMRGQVMPLEAGAQAGTAQGKMRRVHRLKVRLLNSMGGAFGQSFDLLDEMTFRGPDDPMDEALPLFSGIKEASFPGDFDVDTGIVWVMDNPWPCTLVALMPEMATNES